MWRLLAGEGEQTLMAALDNTDGDLLYRDQAARADVPLTIAPALLVIRVAQVVTARAPTAVMCAVRRPA
ncbi:hypothetical protein [Streptomyces chryseus]